MQLRGAAGYTREPRIGGGLSSGVHRSLLRCALTVQRWCALILQRCALASGKRGVLRRTFWRSVQRREEQLPLYVRVRVT
jgi:hypothetical protein